MNKKLLTACMALTTLSGGNIWCMSDNPNVHINKCKRLKQPSYKETQSAAAKSLALSKAEAKRARKKAKKDKK